MVWFSQFKASMFLFKVIPNNQKQKIMKMLFLSIFAIALSFGVFAQDSTRIVMKDGKMMVKKNGEKTQLTQDTTLSNGTSVMLNGTVKTSDGNTVILQNGDFVNMDGTIGKMKKDRKMDTDSLK